MQKNKLPINQSPKVTQSSLQLTVVPVQIISLPATQPRSGCSPILSSPNGWLLEFQDFSSVQ